MRTNSRTTCGSTSSKEGERLSCFMSAAPSSPLFPRAFPICIPRLPSATHTRSMRVEACSESGGQAPRSQRKEKHMTHLFSIPLLLQAAWRATCCSHSCAPRRARPVLPWRERERVLRRRWGAHPDSGSRLRPSARSCAWSDSGSAWQTWGTADHPRGEGRSLASSTQRSGSATQRTHEQADHVPPGVPKRPARARP